MRQSQLLSLADVLTSLSAAAEPFLRTEPIPIANACGSVLAEDVNAPADIPSRPRALRAGFAACAADTLDASVMSPVLLPRVPQRVAAGDELPEGTDAIVPSHAIRALGNCAEALATVSPWDGVRRPGEDAQKGSPLMRSGQALTHARILALSAFSIEIVHVRRPAMVIEKGVERSIRISLEALIAAWGGKIVSPEEEAVALVISADPGAGGSALALEPGLGEARISIQGGSARLSLPARSEAALAVAYALIRPLVARLSKRREPFASQSRALAGKIAVAAGLDNLVLVAAEGERWRVLAASDLPLAAWAEAEAFAVLGPECEGFAPGAALTAFLLTEQA